MKIFKKMKKGFTLVELVVVIAVIAILAAVSVGAYFGVTESANRSKLEQEGKQVHTAIQTISLAGNEHSSLTSNGLEISNPGAFELALEESLGKEVALTDVQNTKDKTNPTIYFTDVAIQSALGDKTYKTFEYHLPEISGKKAQVNVVTGEVKVVETSAAGEELPEVLPTVTTISEALTAEVGYPAIISGTVKEVTYTWNGSTMSYKLTDGTNEILVYICKTQVALGDIVTVTGEIGAYDGANQIVKSTAEITGHDDSYDIQTITSIADALTAPLSTEVELTGTVTEINAEYTSATETSFYLTDDSNASIYVFKLPGKVYLNDKVKVIGQIGQYSGVNQVAKGATFEVIERHTCTYSEATCFEPEKCSICDAVKEGSTALGHTEANAEGNCERCGTNVNTTTITVNIHDYASENDWYVSAGNNTQKQPTVNMDDNIIVTVSGGANSGNYFSNGWRIYATDTPAGKLTFTASEGYEFSSIQIDTLTGTYAILALENTTTDVSNTEVEVNGSIVVFNSIKNGSNGKQVVVTSITVKYIPVDNSGDTPIIPEPEHTTHTFDTTGSCTFEGCDARCNHDNGWDDQTSESSVCATCGFTCNHTVEPGNTCPTCGYEEPASNPVVTSKTIKFNDNGTDASTDVTTDSLKSYCAEGADLIDSVTASKVYKGTTGLKFSSKSTNGTLTIAFSETLKNVKNIVLNAMKYSGDASQISLNDDTAKSLTTTLADYSFEINGDVSSITIKATKRLYLSSITINF